MPACCGSASGSRWPLPSCSRSSRGCRRPITSRGISVASGGVRITSATNRRLRLFAVTQIGASFVLLAGAGMLLTTLFELQRARTGFQTHNVLAVNVPLISFERKPEQVAGFYKEMIRRVIGAAWRRARRDRLDRPVARRGHVRARLPVHDRGIREGERRRRSARAIQDGLAGILRRARRADHRGPRLHRRRPARRRTGGDRQPERRAPYVPRAATR